MAETQSKGTVLVVEDPFVRAFVKTYLTRNGYDVISADYVSGCEMLQAGVPRVDVLITNQPEILRHAPKPMALLYIAAFPDPARASAFPHCRMMHKPFHPEDLRMAVDELMGTRGATD